MSEDTLQLGASSLSQVGMCFRYTGGSSGTILTNKDQSSTEVQHCQKGLHNSWEAVLDWLLFMAQMAWRQVSCIWIPGCP